MPNERTALPQPLPTPHAPPVAGPYSPAIRAGDWVILAGQVGFDPAAGRIVAGGAEAETRQVMANIAVVLADCDASLRHVAKATIFVIDLSDFAAVNRVYADALGEHRPARSTVQVAALPGGARVEIEVWAWVPQ